MIRPELFALSEDDARLILDWHEQHENALRKGGFQHPACEDLASRVQAWLDRAVTRGD